jgi:hypothetical protein
MKAFNVATITALAAAEATFVWLAEITIAGNTYRWTSCDVDLYVSGDLYIARALSIGEVRQSTGLGVSSVQVIMSNIDHSMRWIVLNQEIRATAMTIKFAALDDNAQILATETLFYGLVSTYTIDDLAVTLTLVNELALWKKKSLRQSATSCRWSFKGPECTYSGDEEWCDKTYVRCQTLTNTDSFGGFRFLTDVMERQVRWGRESPKGGTK